MQVVLYSYPQSSINGIYYLHLFTQLLCFMRRSQTWQRHVSYFKFTYGLLSVIMNRVVTKAYF